MRVFLIALIFFLPMYIAAQGDSIPLVSDSASAMSDSTQVEEIDTAALNKTARTPFYNSPFISGDKPKWYDIEQHRNSENDGWIFFLLLQSLIVLTILKLAFHNDFDNLFKTFFNSNIASNSLRISKDDITLSSVLMSTIFITTMSLFTRYVLIHTYPHYASQNNFSIVWLIFLFTFFSIAKYASLKFIGNIFEIQSVVDEYIFNLAAITRTIGISMIPILFISYASSDKYFMMLLIVSLIILGAGVVMLVIRGLSTSYKLMYSSVYHFLIYICLGEILTVFLFIKLLTKTVI